MQKINDQLEMERTIARLQAEGRVPSLLLHSCCGPCSSAVLERLTPYFRVTVFYYNPNIRPAAEFRRRADEQRRLLSLMPTARPVAYREGPYEPEKFDAVARGREREPEGGARCALCYELRMRRAAEAARDGGYDFFTTTLSVSPYKHARTLNEIGARLEREIGVRYLRADFKKKDGFLRSIQLSRKYSLYRQNYCGCTPRPATPGPLQNGAAVDWAKATV